MLLPVFDSLVAAQVAKMNQKFVDKNILHSNQGLKSIEIISKMRIWKIITPVY